MSEQTLIPERATNDVMVPIEETALNSNLSAVSDFCQSMGLMEITPTAVRQLRQAGIAIENLGTTNLTQPTTLATQQAVLKTLNKVAKLMDGPNVPLDTQAKLSHAIGYLAEKITRAGQALNETAQENTAQQTPHGRLRRPSFSPGQVIDVQSTPQPKPASP